MKWLAAALVVVIVLLQYRLWVAPRGTRELAHLEAALDRQQKRDIEMEERNQQLAAEVADLKDGLSAIEERARTDLGMIAPNETFYQVVDPVHHVAPVAAAVAKGEARNAPAR